MEGATQKIDGLTDELAKAHNRIQALEEDNEELRQANHKLGVAAEQLREHVLGKIIL